jgi:vacuolar-type H+-ATPase catalytic subunit A/Vma1
MQNPGSDAGVFVWADGRVADIAPRILTPVATSRRKIRNVTLKKRLHARRDFPAMHTLRKYTMVCVDNFKKYFARESQSEPTVRPLVAQSNVGAGSRLIQNPIEHGTRVFVTLVSVAGNAFA